MLRSSLLAASAVLLCCATASAQTGQIGARKITGAVKDAGVYHVATGTWTRNPGSDANLGADIIYRNDHTSGYFGTGWEGGPGIDEGMLPGPGSPAVGSQNAYFIDGLSFSYCARGNVGGIDWGLVLYDSYVACDRPQNPANCTNAVWDLELLGLPTNPTVGVQSCWIITLDLAGGFEACMMADGGPCAPGYQGGALNLDSFGFSQVWNNDGQLAGPILNGNPDWTGSAGGTNQGRGDGTCYSTAQACAGGSTGLGALDRFGIDCGGNLNPGCYWFGGYVNNNNGCGGVSNNPMAQMNLTLFNDCTATCNPGQHVCEEITCNDCTDDQNFADASVDDCDATSDNALIVSLDNATPDKFSYLLISKGQSPKVDPPGSDGTLCVGSGGNAIGRYANDIAKTDAAGHRTTDLMNANTGGGGGGVPTIGGNIVGGTWYVQYWFRFDNSATGSRFSSMSHFGPVL